jgi:Flp pilus assembly protein TadG
VPRRAAAAAKFATDFPGFLRLFLPIRLRGIHGSAARIARMNMMGSIMRGLARVLAALGADRRGGAAVLLAVAAVPLVAAIGLSVDGARGWLVKARLSQAIDAAALAGGRVMSPTKSPNADIEMFFNANFPPGFMNAEVDGPHIAVDADNTTITINARATIPTTFMRVVGIKELTVRADTEVKRTDRGMELVLVMDNTGSMHEKAGTANAKIVEMKSAAKLLIDSLYGSRDTVPTLWVGLVPYAAIVNIGTENSAMTKVRSTPLVNISSATIVNNEDSIQNGRVQSVTVCVTTNGHPFWDGAIVDISGFDQSVYNGRHLIRNVTGKASDGSPIECEITDSTKKFWFVVEGRTVASGGSLVAPTGTAIKAQLPPTDYSQSKDKDNNPVGWKGCVEARIGNNLEEENAELYPTSESEKWVQAFWPSTKGMKFFNKNKRESTRLTPSPTPVSNFPNVATPTSFSNTRDGDNDWGDAVLAPGRARVDERTWDYFAYGPNFGCPTPILPLQQSRTTVKDEIDKMEPTGRSGTMANVGLAWGWRVLSENFQGKWAGSPSTLPLAYNTPLMSKVVVLLTDGQNLWNDMGHVGPGRGGIPSAYESGKPWLGLPEDADYSAYGRLSERRLGSTITNVDQAKGAINNRMLRLCTEMKKKGIIIYTIILQENDTATQNLYKNCASEPKDTHAYFAPTSDKLNGIFSEIATQLANLRLSR